MMIHLEKAVMNKVVGEKLTHRLLKCGEFLQKRSQKLHLARKKEVDLICVALYYFSCEDKLGRLKYHLVEGLFKKVKFFTSGRQNLNDSC
jgi:hypothetical protein